MFSREPAPPGKDTRGPGEAVSVLRPVCLPPRFAGPSRTPASCSCLAPNSAAPPSGPLRVTTGHSDDRSQCPPWRLCVFLTHMVMGEGNSSYLRGHAVLSPFTRPAAPGWRARASAGPLCCPEASGQQPGAGEGVTPT